MSCPYSWVSGWKGCAKNKKCAECRGMGKILKVGKCVECKKPTSKTVLRENGGTCGPCTDEEMAETEREAKFSISPSEALEMNIALGKAEREALRNSLPKNKL